MALTDQLTDLAGVVRDEAEVRQAIAQATDAGVNLHIVVVNSFDGTEPRSWSLQTAQRTGLGANAAVFALAVEDRQYFLMPGDGVPLSNERIDSLLNNDVRPHLQNADWDTALVSLGQALASELGGRRTDYDDDDRDEERGSASRDSDSNLDALAPIALFGAGGAALAGTIYVWRRKKKSAGASGPSGQGRLSFPQHLEQATRELVAADDAVRTGKEEYEFARAQFGELDTDRFLQALKKAEARLAEAYGIRRHLEAVDPLQAGATEAGQIEKVRSLSQEALAELQQHEEEFARLRALHTNLPQVIERTAELVREARAKNGVAQAQLSELQAQYSPGALVSVSNAPTEALARLDAAEQALEQARQAAAQQQKNEAIEYEHIAERALTQARSLLESVAVARERLANAAGEMARAVASLSSDLADVERLVPGQEGFAALAERARAAIKDGQASLQGGDPLAALAELAAAEEALDLALAPARQADEVAQRAAARLRPRLERCRAALEQLERDISTHRGGATHAVRDLVARAQTELGRAEHAAKQSPDQASVYLSTAEALVHQARSQLVDDINSFGGHSGSSGGGIDLTSLILGGILSNMGGSSGWRGGGSWGSSDSWGGSRRGGGFSGGGFGGGTRGSGGSF